MSQSLGHWRRMFHIKAKLAFCYISSVGQIKPYFISFALYLGCNFFIVILFLAFIIVSFFIALFGFMALFFKLYFWLCYYNCPDVFLLAPSIQPPLLSQAIPPVHPHPHCSCPRGMCISSLATLFPILYFTSPWLFCNYLCFLIPSPLHPFPYTLLQSGSHLVTNLFSLAVLKSLSLSLTLGLLIMMCLGVGLFASIIIGTLCASWTCMSVSFTKLGKFSFTIFSGRSPISCSFSSSGTPRMWMLDL